MLSTNLGAHYFLTSKRRDFLSFTGNAVKSQLEKRLLASGDPIDLESGVLILDLYENNDPELKKSLECFVLEILKYESKDRLEVFKAVAVICQKKGFKGFFRCVRTKKIEYYSSKTLLEILKVFTRVAEKNSDLSSLSRFPCYDERGKIWIDQLNANPDLSAFSLTEERSPAPRLLLLSANQLKEVLNETSSYEKVKTLAIRYLTSLPNTNRSSIQLYQKIFREVQQASKYSCLPELCKVILIKIILITTTREHKAIARKSLLGDLDELTQEILILYHLWGEESLIQFFDALAIQQTPSLDGVITGLRLCNLLSKNHTLSLQVETSLQTFALGKCSLEKFIEILEEYAPEVSIPSEEEDDLDALWERFRGKDPNVQFPLPKKYLQTIQKQYGIIQDYSKKFQKLRIGQLVERASEIRDKGLEKGFQEDDLLQLLAIGRLAAFIKFQKYARNTQILAILGQLCDVKGAVVQMKTGEGKSLVTTLLAFVESMQNKNVHVISSNHYLAKRDQSKAGGFFETFGITTSNICNQHSPSKSFTSKIIYGTASDFEFAIMRELLSNILLFERKMNSRGKEKRFDVAIIDESDNLTIDTASSQARLSYAREETHDWIYFPIFLFVKESIGEDTENLNGATNKLRSLLTRYANGYYKEQVNTFDDQQLETWLEAAYKALYRLHEEDDYAILQDSENPGENKIVIVDAENTGRLMWGSRWSDGMHEFVELKHHITPQRENLCPISLSHPVFYPMYHSLYGLTGTLGESPEREELKEIYGVSTFDVPTFRPSLRKDFLPEVVFTQNEFLQKILIRINKCQKEKRPILILSKNIQHSKLIGAFLEKENIPHELLNEVQKKTEEELLDKAGYPGAVTVATNTAARGTDIELKEGSDVNGGLHTLIGFFPESLRVENQGRGRGGRQGQDGSSEVLICLEHLNDIPKDLKSKEKVLEYLELQRIYRARMMKEMHLLQTKIERHLFVFVQQFYEQLGKFQNNLQNETFIESIANALSKRKIRPKDLDLQQLKPQDRQIAEEALELLTDKEKNVIRWKTLLLQIGSRLKDKIINIWSLEFYHKIETLLKEERMKAAFEIKYKLGVKDFANRENDVYSEFFKKLEKNLIQSETKHINDLKQTISFNFDQKKQNWDKYLDPTGNGLIQYIREITDTTLNGIEDAIEK